MNRGRSADRVRLNDRSVGEKESVDGVSRWDRVSQRQGGTSVHRLVGKIWSADRSADRGRRQVSQGETGGVHRSKITGDLKRSVGTTRHRPTGLRSVKRGLMRSQARQGGDIRG